MSKKSCCCRGHRRGEEHSAYCWTRKVPIKVAK